MYNFIKFLFMLVVTMPVEFTTGNVNNLIINSTVINKVNDNYMSIALDTIVIAEKFKGFNMTNERLKRMTSYLSPGYLRIGGNLADQLYFSSETINDTKILNKVLNETSTCKDNYCAKVYKFFEKPKIRKIKEKKLNFTMTGSEWMRLNKFAAETGFTIVFDLNCLIRNDDGSWNSKNAEELIQFSDHNGYNIHWQLGNEPNAFKYMFHYSVNATQLGRDFITLKAILEKFPRYKKSLLIGPDVTCPHPKRKRSLKYLKQFLSSSKNHIVDVIAWHQYYLNGHKATLQDFINPKTFSLLEYQITKIKETIDATGYNNTPIWLSETSSAFGGGAKELSNTFAASFLWLDKLGVSAKFGLQSVVRQSLYHGHYSLIDKDYSPLSDWWISYIYKKFIGNEVLSCGLENNSPTTRLYCHCLKRERGSPLHNSAVIVYGININNKYEEINIKGIESDSKLVLSYIITSRNLQSKHVYLNEQLMELLEDGDLPFYEPQFLNFGSVLYMPPYSLVFWIIPTNNMCNDTDILAFQV